RPPDRKTPTGTSLTSAASTARSSSSRSRVAAVSTSTGSAGSASSGASSQNVSIRAPRASRTSRVPGRRREIPSNALTAPPAPPAAPVAEVAAARRAVDDRRDGPGRQDRLWLGCEEKRVRGVRVVQRLLAHAITREDEPVRPRIPDRYGEHPVERIDEARTPL